MKNQKLIFSFLACLSVLINVPTVLCMTPAPIVYVAGDDSGDFNCNGTNDQIPINQALQFVAENSDYTTVYLKGPVTYVIKDTLLIGNNTILEGDPTAVIKLADNVNWGKDVSLIQQINGSGNHDITIRGFTINGNREGNDEITSGNGYHNLISLSNCQKLNVHDMYLTNNHGDGLKTNNCTSVKFYDNEAYLLGHDVLYASKCQDVEAYNNRITCRTNSGLRVYNTNHVSFYNNNITSKGYGGAGIEIQKEGTNYTMNDVEVYNNTIYRTALSGIWIFGSGFYSNSTTNVHVHHNQIYDTGTSSSRSNIGGIVSDGFDVLVENNVIDGAYGTGITQKNVYNNNESSSALNSSGYVITARNNIISNIRLSSDGGNGYGISNFLTDTHSFVLENNCLYNNSGDDYSGVDTPSTDIYEDPLYADRGNHDYHLKSKAGRWNGDEWVNDSVSSPCIDAGHPLSDYSNEPKPNGNRINIGLYGNTGYASKSEVNESTLIFPVANFSTNVTEGYAPLSVQFNDISENATGWRWDFGDEASSTDRNPMHIYSAAGNYTVNLIASNTNGTASKSSTINVTEKPVLPVFPGCTNPPTDSDNDGLYEDIGGNGMLDFNDVVIYYDNLEWISKNAPVAFFDYNDNNLIDFDDVVKLYDMVV